MKAGIYMYLTIYVKPIYNIYIHIYIYWYIVYHITYITPRCYVHHVNPHVACLLALTGLASGSYSQGRGQEAKHDG